VSEFHVSIATTGMRKSDCMILSCNAVCHFYTKQSSFSGIKESVNVLPLDINPSSPSLPRNGVLREGFRVPSYELSRALCGAFLSGMVEP
jgi:hypothetical protein